MRLRPVLALSLLALAACAAPAVTRYYTLSSASLPHAAAKAVPDYRVAIGPVGVPEALDRSQIVLRVAPNRYAIADAEHWATPLKREIPRAVAQEVGERLPAARVVAYFQYDGQSADYRVAIEVLRLEAVPGKSVALDAAWTVRNRAGERLREARTVFVEPVSSPGIAALVRAHARALSVLSREIAEIVDVLARSNR